MVGHSQGQVFMSKLVDYIGSSPTVDETKDSITKRISSAAAIMCLPSPGNWPGKPDLIADVPVELVLSTTDKMPASIRDLIQTSESRVMLEGHHLWGLCISGLGYPVKLFLHQAAIDRFDPGGARFEDYFFHEYV